MATQRITTGLAGNAGAAAGASSRRFLIITDVNDPSLVVFRQANL